MAYMVQVLYHPENPSALERQYPGHLKLPGVAKLVEAAKRVDAGPIGGQVGGKTVTRAVVFVFADEEAWKRVASDPDGAAAVADASRIAGPGGLSVLAGAVEISK